MDLKETDILGDDIAAHWYYQAKAAATLRLLRTQEPKVILDVGAGSGFFSRYLLAHTSASAAWCVDISYLEDVDSEAQGKPIYYRRSLDAVDADTVLLMDVLEHVEDDAALLADYARRVPAGAQFLISVPAFEFLWSGHDEFLEHKRRYRLSQLDACVRRAGLKPVIKTYYFGLVFPLAVTTRLATRLLTSRGGVARSQLKRHGPFTNAALAAVCKAELPFLRVNRLAGLTAFCLAVR
jgi:SAM-dependent methyltransferase